MSPAIRRPRRSGAYGSKRSLARRKRIANAPVTTGTASTANTLRTIILIPKQTMRVTTLPLTKTSTRIRGSTPTPMRAAAVWPLDYSQPRRYCLQPGCLTCRDGANRSASLCRLCWLDGRFFSRPLRGLRHISLDENLLVTIAVIAAFAMGNGPRPRW